MNTKTLYLAGPMRGYVQYNFPAFDVAKVELEVSGYRVINPADLDRACGFRADDKFDPANKSRFMLRDLAELSHCDGIALLDGWGSSSGVAVEVAYGQYLGLPIKPVKEWL